MSRNQRLAQLPQVDRLLQHPVVQKLITQYPRKLIIEVIREKLAVTREQLLQDEAFSFQLQLLLDQITQALQEKFKPSLRRSVNAAGIILHTNMGRAPLSSVAQQALQDVAENFSNLEIDVITGKRGVRYQHVEELICELTGAEAALVVNNNAAATLLVLNTLAFNKESIVSRGELITIGDSFRLPAIMRHGGTRMVEVGTTNQTFISDFEQEITAETGLIVKIHTSNFKIIGFTAEPTLAELVELGHQNEIPVYHDVGSGALVDLSRYQLPKEPVIQESLTTGADVVSFSGDKLIGGPQAGVIVGKKKYIQQMKQNQLTRALRAGKLTYAALEATLRLFLDEPKLPKQHAVMRLLTKTLPEIEQQAQSIIHALKSTPLRLEIIDGLSEVGGGSLATESLPTKLLVISTGRHSAKQLSVEQLAQRLRAHQPPIISRIQNNQVCLDMRTVREDENEFIINALQNILPSNQEAS